MAEKPSYIDLLNNIAVGEGRAGVLLRAWAQCTKDAAVRQILETVAIREAEHALAFEKRLCELGHAVQETPDPGQTERLRLVTSGRSDLEKMEALGYGALEKGIDFFDGVFKDHTIDIRTGELLGRYIAEEHDSVRLLVGCYQALKQQAAAPARNGGAAAPDVVAALQSLSEVVKGLRQEVAALSSR